MNATTVLRFTVQWRHCITWLAGLYRGVCQICQRFLINRLVWVFAWVLKSLREHTPGAPRKLSNWGTVQYGTVQYTGLENSYKGYLTQDSHGYPILIILNKRRQSTYAETVLVACIPCDCKGPRGDKGLHEAPPKVGVSLLWQSISPVVNGDKHIAKGMLHLKGKRALRRNESIKTSSNELRSSSS